MKMDCIRYILQLIYYGLFALIENIYRVFEIIVSILCILILPITIHWYCYFRKYFKKDFLFKNTYNRIYENIDRDDIWDYTIYKYGLITIFYHVFCGIIIAILFGYLNNIIIIICKIYMFDILLIGVVECIFAIISSLFEENTYFY